MIKIDLKDISKAPEDWSDVFDYREDISVLEEQIEDFKKFENIIVIGNGGSITSYDAYYGALGSARGSATVWTMEPDYLKSVRDKYGKDNTVVVVISKSGNTLGLIESLMYFVDYSVIAVTNPDDGSLCEIAKKMDWKIIPHPAIGGRFSGGTSSAFVPSLLAGLDVRAIQEGIAGGYSLKNMAYSLSKYYFDLEKDGYNEIFVPIYSQRLKDFQNMIVQLMHESACKDGKGQTFYCSLAPESQHHTNQRFIGGKKNVIGTFIVVKKSSHESKIQVPQELSEINYKGENLSVINGINYQDALRAEYIGTKTDADEKQIPNVTIEIDEISPQSVGELLSFWHLVAFYSSVLRGVNPFDQPAVENSKNITLNEIKKLI
jgi:glucose-6-phosphate isomerase